MKFFKNLIIFGVLFASANLMNAQIRNEVEFLEFFDKFKTAVQNNNIDEIISRTNFPFIERRFNFGDETVDTINPVEFRIRMEEYVQTLKNKETWEQIKNFEDFIREDFGDNGSLSVSLGYDESEGVYYTLVNKCGPASYAINAVYRKINGEFKFVEYLYEDY